MTSTLALYGGPRTAAPPIGAKGVAGLPPLGTRIPDFDTWRPGYAGASIEVIIAGTTTLAPIYSDVGLTVLLTNPIALLTLADANGETYGKFSTPVYTYVPYTLFTNQGNETGIERPPLTTLDGADASLTTVTSSHGRYPVALQSWFDRDVDATLFGPLSNAAGSEQCTATLALAIGNAAALQGGRVLLPPIEIPFTSLTLPQGVVLRGKGKGATTLISTQTGSPVIVLGGDGAGLENLTLDGLDLAPQSIGVYGVGVALPVFNEVVIKRFESGLRLRGVVNALWNDLTVTNCSSGADIRGDLDASATGAGSESENVQWNGGEVSLCTVFGLNLFFFDAAVRDMVFDNVAFVSNTGDAIRIKGARGPRFEMCQWDTNISNLSVADGDNLSFVSQNTTERVRFVGGRMNGGTLTFNQTCLDIQFRDMELLGVSGVLNVPTNPIIFQDCIENGLVSFTGDLTKLVQRSSTAITGIFSGVTTDATPTAAWEMVVPPGGVVLVSAKAIGRSRNGVALGIFWEIGGAYRPAATLPFQSATGTFTVGLVLTGATSGASARIVTVTQAGANGTLAIRDIVGTFIVGELVADTSTGSGRFQGSIGYSDAALDATGSTHLRTPQTTGTVATAWALAITVLGSLVQATVTGEASKIVEWSVDISVLAP